MPKNTSANAISYASPCWRIHAKHVSDTAVVPPANIVFSGTGAPRTARITSVLNQNTARMSTVTIWVSDGQRSGTLLVDVWVGTQNDDTISGTANRANVILGLGGQDTLTGGSASDLICGGEGDLICGGANNDTATDYSATEGDTKISVP